VNTFFEGETPISGKKCLIFTFSFE